MPSYSTNLVYPYGTPSIKGRLKTNLNDFKVYEELGFEPTGEGEHLYLLIEKEDTTTDSVNQALARHYGIKPYHIADCGLKDAKAITRQWFSVHLPGYKGFPDDPISDDFKVLRRDWSLKKLKKGAHKGNKFQITVRGVIGNEERAIKQLELIKKSGFANYFGEQRFGKGQRNVDNAMDAFTHGKKLSRSKKSLYLSSLRSFLFNKILTKRLEEHNWLTPIEGDCYMLNGTRSTFCDEISDDINRRYLECDIHAIVSLAGEGEGLMSQVALDIEQQVMENQVDMVNILIAQGLKKDKRAIRQMINNLSYEFNDDVLELRFYLPKGCYATTLIKHFCDY